jgi:hypothetical protein
LFLELLVNIDELLQTTGIDSFTITTSYNAIGRGDKFMGIFILLQELEEMPGGIVFFQMKADERFKLMFEGQFQGSIPSRFKRRNGIIDTFNWLP